jgi:hypothetical protein
MTGIAAASKLCRELAFMCVLMARPAGIKFRVIVGCQPLWFMALVAHDGRVFSGQRITRGCMKLDIKCSGLEPADGVTRSTFDASGPRRELTAVFVRVTIDAFSTANRRTEIRALVTITAGDRRVLARESVGCSAVVKIGDHRCSRHMPASRFMALPAGAWKPAIVRIGMAA